MDLKGKNVTPIVVDGIEYTVHKHVKEDIYRLLKKYPVTAKAAPKLEPFPKPTVAAPPAADKKKDGKGK